ncbi:putative catechol O-methyltransferase 1 [Penicillium brasilianum]|uniref:catechol O-methyltransferase n=1 Tax=Penicillium brasilianum TaxID=104259 RepID=A0A1S9R8F0_PENBI|nr:putative catechol O-methyltransferase 1 [Penicillium brasilianum]
MSTIAKPHAPEPRPWCLDGREVDLLHYIYGRPDIKELRGNPQKILTAIDDYNVNHNMLMNVGPVKGAHITSLISKHKPSTMIELGGYIGYSAILFGDAIRANGGKKFYTLEKNPEMAAVANQLVELAGLRDIVHILIGSSDELLVELVRERNEIDQIEMLFLDHWQDLYLPDLWLLEEMGVLAQDRTLLVADNVIMPGAPQYLEWVKGSPSQKSAMVEKLNTGSLKPNPNLVYETEVPEFETDGRKDGLAITRVVGEVKG